MMPRSPRHGSASLTSSIPAKEPHGHENIREKDLDNLAKEGTLRFTSHLQGVIPGRAMDSTPPSDSSNIPILKNSRKDKPPAQVSCRYFNAGYCARADKCLYKHDLEEVRLQKVELKIVLKSHEDARLREEAPQKEPLLPKEYMLPGRHQKALTHWRKEYWETKILQARAHQSQLAEDDEENLSERSKVQKDLKRIQNKNDPLGESARKVAEAKNQRKTVFVKGKSEDPGVPIPLDAEGCPICHDEPGAITVYGLMENCNHVFCYDCIIGWRKTNIKNKHCPICRAKSAFTLKSSVYPYTPGMKLEDHSKPVEGAKPPSESNRPTMSKSGAQEDGAGNVAMGVCSSSGPANSTDQGKARTDTHKPTLVVYGQAGDSNLHLDTHERSNANPDVAGHSTIISSCNEDRRSHDEDDDHELVPVPISPHLHGSAREPPKRKRSRRKPAGDPEDPNPAKTVLIHNYLKKCKATPCKYFCNPKNAKIVTLDSLCSDTQSSLWGQQSAGESGEDVGLRDITARERKIPYCKFGNNCNFAHPQPEKPDEEYKYDVWERRVLGFSRRRKRMENSNHDDSW